MEVEDFDSSLQLSTNFLFLAGLRLSKTKLLKPIAYFIDYCLVYFSIFWLGSVVVAEMTYVINGAITGKHFLEYTMVLPCVIISLLANVKILVLYNHKGVLVEIVDKLRDWHAKIDDYDNDVNEMENYTKLRQSSFVDSFENAENETDVKKKMITDSVKLLNRVTYRLFNTTLVVVCSFWLMPLIAMAYEYFTTGSTDYKTPFLVIYFFSIDNFPIWLAVFVHHMGATVVVWWSLYGADLMFYALCVYVQMHFRLLGHQLENMVFRSPGKMRIDIAKIVRKHQALINMVEQVELLYSKSMLFNILTSSMLICLSGFIVTMITEFMWVVTFALFLNMSLSQIFLLCYFGDKLMNSSTQISSAVYNALWYQADNRTKKILLSIMTRSQKPCRVTAYKFADVNLEMFASILSRSWSYFALLKTMFK